MTIILGSLGVTFYLFNSLRPQDYNDLDYNYVALLTLVVCFVARSV